MLLLLFFVVVSFAHDLSRVCFSSLEHVVAVYPLPSYQGVVELLKLNFLIYFKIVITLAIIGVG